VCVFFFAAEILWKKQESLLCEFICKITVARSLLKMFPLGKTLVVRETFALSMGENGQRNLLSLPMKSGEREEICAFSKRLEQEDARTTTKRADTDLKLGGLGVAIFWR